VPLLYDAWEIGVRSPARPTISVEKLALSCNPASARTSHAIALHCIVKYKKNAVAEACGDMRGRTLGRSCPGTTLKSVAESEGVPAS
jgi:hypothetical protein